MHNNIFVSLLAAILSIFIASSHTAPSAGVLPAHTSQHTPIQNLQVNQNNTSLSQPSKTSGCVATGGLPDTACTPGAVLPATKEQICVSGYSKAVRNVPLQEKDQVYAAYGIASHQPGQYEVDHLVSLELGGSNDISNLWPEAAEPRPGFHEKDAVENYLHAQVCSGALSLQQAQQEIATNWLQVYTHVPDILRYNYTGPHSGSPTK